MIITNIESGETVAELRDGEWEFSDKALQLRMEIALIEGVPEMYGKPKITEDGTVGDTIRTKPTTDDDYAEVFWEWVFDGDYEFQEGEDAGSNAAETAG